MIKLCRPYRAKTKGKLERLNGYLRRSLHVLLVVQLKQAELGCVGRVQIITSLINALSCLVPGAGIEPARSFDREILSLLCLPVSPPGQAAHCTEVFGRMVEDLPPKFQFGPLR